MWNRLLCRCIKHQSFLTIRFFSFWEALKWKASENGNTLTKGFRKGKHWNKKLQKRETLKWKASEKGIIETKGFRKGNHWNERLQKREALKRKTSEKGIIEIKDFKKGSTELKGFRKGSIELKGFRKAEWNRRLQNWGTLKWTALEQGSTESDGFRGIECWHWFILLLT